MPGRDSRRMVFLEMAHQREHLIAKSKKFQILWKFWYPPHKPLHQIILVFLIEGTDEL